MYNITILSSFHIERGKCNSNELYRIIEKIQPEIIFEELPYDVFEIIYAKGGSPESLEAITIKKYLEKNQIEHIPVDTYEINETDLFNEFNVISNKSIEYAELMKQQLSMIIRNGYSFLNSNDCDELLDKIHIIEENILLEINDAWLSYHYKTDRELHDKREDEMLQNIYNYSKQYPYNKALFICGAEHRKSIMQKIQGYELKEKLKLNWTLYNASQIS
jgi:hypothetical protein